MTKPATAARFRGSFTALVTPFKNGAPDEAAFRDHVAWQIAEGTVGLVPVGTTGESPTLSHDEHKRVVEWCIAELDGRSICADETDIADTSIFGALRRRGRQIG